MKIIDLTPHRNWFSEKVEIANSVFQMKQFHSEPDAQIILCCAIGALSAMRWPGTKKDRVRFIEFLIKFTPQTQTISIPSLIEKLCDKGHPDTARFLTKKYYDMSLNHYRGKIHLDDDTFPPQRLLLRKVDSNLDPTETQFIEDVLPEEISFDGLRQLIRESSYAALIYTDFRCGLIHNYRAQGNTTSDSMSFQRRDRPSYLPKLIGPPPSEQDVQKMVEKYKKENISADEARASLSKSIRRLYLPYEYTRDLFIETANSAFDDWETWKELDPYNKPSSWKADEPSPWWISKYDSKKANKNRAG